MHLRSALPCEVLHLWPGIGLKLLERRAVLRPQALKELLFHRRARAHALVPGVDARQTLPHAVQAQELEAQDVRDHRRVGERERRAREPRSTRERAVHHLEKAAMVGHRVAHVLGIEPVERDVALVFGALLARRLGELLLDLLAAETREPGPESGGEGEDRA